MQLVPSGQPFPLESQFPFGIASGDPTSSSIELWTRVDVSRGATRVRWRVWKSECDATVDSRGDHRLDRVGHPVSGECEPVDGFVRVSVPDLSPGQRYCYGFSTAGEDSPVGRFTTLPAATVSVATERFRLAVVCCSRWPSGSFRPYEAVAAQRPDLVLHLGDYIYSDGGDGPRGPHIPKHRCVTEEDYSLRYAQYRSDACLQHLHAAAPMVAVWDDHEFLDNAWSNRFDPAWQSQRRNAERAHSQWMPQRSHGNGPTAMDRTLSVPGLFDLVVVDCRMAGRDEPQGDGGPVVVSQDEPRRLLTSDQWSWLEASIEASRAPWLLLATSVQFAPLRLAPVPRRAVPPWRWLVNSDQWDGYPGERERLLGLLRGRDQVLVLSGDLHARFETILNRGETRITEITTPSISAPSFASSVRRSTRLPVPALLLESWLRVLNPHLRSLDLTHHGATIIDFTPSGWTLTELDEW